jgi:hypothetical protein
MAPKYEKCKNFNPGIRPYHELGPLADLADPTTTARLVESVTGCLLPEVVSPKEKIQQWQRNMMNPSLYLGEAIDPTKIGDLASAYRDIGDAAEATGHDATSRMLYGASLVALGTRMEPSSSELLAINEAKDWFHVRGLARPGSELPSQSVDKRRIGALNQVLSERQVIDGGLKDGPAFEIALMAILQYDHYSSEQEDQNNFARMARTREDMPARGMPPEKGTRVAHDVVYIADGETYRIQAKFGASAGDAATDRYDTRYIVEVVEENMDSRDLTDVFTALIRAYNDDPEASRTILSLAEKYKSQIHRTRTRAAAKMLELVSA